MAPPCPHPILPGVCIVLGGCGRTAVPSLPPMLPPVRGCPGALWVLPSMQSAGGLGHCGQGAGKSLSHAEVPGQSHALLPGEPARESPLLKAKVRDTETGTAERGRDKEGGDPGER